MPRLAEPIMLIHRGEFRFDNSVFRALLLPKTAELCYVRYRTDMAEHLILYGGFGAELAHGSPSIPSTLPAAPGMRVGLKSHRAEVLVGVSLGDSRRLRARVTG